MAILCRYTYDPLDRVSTLTPLAQAVFNRFYNGEQLMTELQGGRQRTCVRAGGQLLAQQLREGDEVVTTMIAGDRNNSVLHASEAGQQSDFVYTPFGHHQAVQASAELPGFNGEQPDPLTGHYLLGNGYRAYNPVLMRFNSPDSMSPFGKGGLNAYAYCVGDPVNRVDPTGHFSALAALISGIVLSAAGAGAIATAAGLKDSDSTLGTTLTVVGSISLMAGLGAFATTGFKLKQTSVKLKQMRAKAKELESAESRFKKDLAGPASTINRSSSGSKKTSADLSKKWREYEVEKSHSPGVEGIVSQIQKSDLLMVEGKIYYAAGHRVHKLRSVLGVMKKNGDRVDFFRVRGVDEVLDIESYDVRNS
ncbi:RHS repeat-associated core domain-containing protein [Pseudomonas syringae]|uniref:RHS repeat-associated core domain-containing protein n=1 Tax=Pseudomonas syringae TaxID=317 RepID=UPI00215633F7|nr:RHS repeat-associated core domain-containing protein [Pseudomonas syringae]